MTAVNVTTNGKTTVVENTATNTVSITTTGPQGPLASGFVFDGSGKVDDSIVYFDQAAGSLKRTTLRLNYPVRRRASKPWPTPSALKRAASGADGARVR